MRLAVAISLVLLGGCPQPGGDDGTVGLSCFVDEECSAGEVCARDSQCWLASDVRPVRATWTLNGQPADETTCARFPELYIEFHGSSVDDLGFSPVPCANGLFTVDKLPRGFTRVEVGVDRGPWDSASFNSAGQAALDLLF